MSQSSAKKTVRQRSGIQSMPSMSVSTPGVSYPAVSSPTASTRTVYQPESAGTAPTVRQTGGSNPNGPPKKRVPAKKTNLSDDVRNIREVESRPGNNASEEEIARRTARMREQAVARDNRVHSKYNSAYPINVDWTSKKVKKSFISLLSWVYFIAVIGVLIYAYLARDVALPTGTDNPAKPTSTTLGEKNITIAVASTQPPLVQTLLSLPSAPIFSCPDGSGTDAAQMTTVKGTAIDGKVSIQSPLILTGTFCNNNNTRIGYCVRDQTCHVINNMATAPTNTNKFAICSSSTGPRRNGLYMITGTFLETLSDYPLNTVIPVVIGFIAGFVWLLVAVSFPTFAPLLLPIFSVGGIIALYVTWKTAILGGQSDNYYILIYGGLVALFVLGTFKHQTRIGRILRIGNLVLSGQDQEKNHFPVTDESGRPVTRRSISILFFSILYPFLQGVCGLCLVYGMGAAIQVTEFKFSRLESTAGYVTGERWASYALGISKTVALGAFAGLGGSVQVTSVATASQSADCSFYDFVNMKAGAAVLAAFFFLYSIYLEHAARYQVGASCADWYFFGTRNYRPPASGPGAVGRISFARSMFNVGSRILSCGIVSQLTTSSATILSGFVKFIINFIISPIDAVIYSFVGVLFLGMNRFKTRFALIHSSMKIGPIPKTDVADKNSAYMVRRVYGFRYAMPGDSPESRVLLVSGSLVSVGCGLITWAWTDYYQNYDSIAYLSFWVIVIVWLTGSAISRPSWIAMLAILIDAYYPFALSLQAQMSKNSVMGFIIVSAITNCIIRTFIQIPCAAVDSVVYCYAIETVKRKRIRSLKLDEMIHVDYMGDNGKVPAGTRLERIIVECPRDAKPGKKITVEVEGERYDITIPEAARPGQDFEVAIPIPFNRVDKDEEEEVVDDDEDDQEAENELVDSNAISHDTDRFDVSGRN